MKAETVARARWVWAAVAASAMVCGAAGEKPLALAGDASSVRAFTMDVTVNNRIRTEDRTKEWLAPSDYGTYAVVAIEGALGAHMKTSKLWLEPGAMEAVRSYVEGGGVIVLAGAAAQRLSRDNPAAAELIGITSFVGGGRFSRNVRLAGDDRLLLWSEAMVFLAEKLKPGTETLAEAESESGRRLAIATRHKVGAGAVYWVSPTCAMLDMRFSAMKRPLTEADEQGATVPTPEGEAVNALRKLYRDILFAAPTLDRSAPPNEWELKPLGAPGGIDTNGTFAVKPVWKPSPTFRPGLRFLGAGAAGVVVALPGANKAATSSARSRAEEFAWHMGEMVGRAPDVVVAPKPPLPEVAVVIGDAAAAKSFGMDVGEHPYGTSVIRRFGNRLYVGGTGAGVSYSVTYLLEALGCRYLWPGRLGKVIPKRNEVTLPELDWTYTPLLKFREIRQFRVSYHHDKEGLLESWGIDQKTFAPRYADLRYDRKGNRDFFKWHGVNDERDIPGGWRWGHYFGHYWQKYGEAHPDWFALQPNGSRRQELSDRQERPTLCTSNPGFIEQAAKDAVAAFKRDPNLRSFSICLPDGGPTMQCMCRACRALDPVNAPATAFQIGNPWWRWYPYVSLTDRMLAFDNAVAERLVKEVPDAKLGVYIYSMYEKPSVKVKPHPALVLLTVAGSYATMSARKYARANIAYWSRYDNMLLWRPNVFFSYATTAPQNYARLVFEDLELFKRNHVVGTDFDCMNEQFATKGLIWYMTAKAHRNPDEVGYETLLEDYCRSGFGAGAADVKAYFDALERMADRAAVRGDSLTGRPGQHDFAALYAEALDPDELKRHLDAAERAAAGDADALKRIAYLRLGLDAGRISKRLGMAWLSKDREGVLAAQRELKALVRDVSMNVDPFALSPVYMTGTYHSPHMKKPNF